MADILKFTIKALIAGAVIVALYYVVSPYQNCWRDRGDSDDLINQRVCRTETNW